MNIQNNCRPVALLLLLLLSVSLQGCNITKNQTKNTPVSNVLKWDLSTTQTLAAVGWPTSNTTDIYSLEDVVVDEVTFAPGVSVRNFPAIYAFVTRSDASRPMFYRIDLRTAPMSLDDAHVLATQWAKHFNLDTTNMNNWYAHRKVETEQDRLRDPYSGILAQPAGDAPDPIIAVEIHSSGNEQLRWDVDIQAYWAKNN